MALELLVRGQGGLSCISWAGIFCVVSSQAWGGRQENAGMLGRGAGMPTEVGVQVGESQQVRLAEVRMRSRIRGR